MTRHINITEYRVDKSGRPVTDYRHLDVCSRLKRKAGKRIRPAKSRVQQSAGNNAAHCSAVEPEHRL